MRHFEDIDTNSLISEGEQLRLERDKLLQQRDALCAILQRNCIHQGLERIPGYPIRAESFVTYCSLHLGQTGEKVSCKVPDSCPLLIGVK